MQWYSSFSLKLQAYNSMLYHGIFSRLHCIQRESIQLHAGPFPSKQPYVMRKKLMLPRCHLSLNWVHSFVRTLESLSANFPLSKKYYMVSSFRQIYPQVPIGGAIFCMFVVFIEYINRAYATDVCQTLQNRKGVGI